MQQNLCDLGTREVLLDDDGDRELRERERERRGFAETAAASTRDQQQGDIKSQ